MWQITYRGFVVGFLDCETGEILLNEHLPPRMAKRIERRAREFWEGVIAL